jgi:hypothetical protein
MGFELPREVVLEFDGPYRGLEIRCSATVPIRALFRIQQRAAEVANADDDGGEAFELLFREWFEAVKPSWNAEVGGEPVECTAETMLTMLPADLCIRLIPQWRQAVSGVDPTSPGSSPSGEPPRADPIPTLAALSSSLPS